MMFRMCGQLSRRRNKLSRYVVEKAKMNRAPGEGSCVLKVNVIVSLSCLLAEIDMRRI